MKKKRIIWPARPLNREPTRCSGLAEHALHPGAVAAWLGSKQRPRAARGEAARVGKWWLLLDSKVVTLFEQQHDQGTWCEQLLAINTWYMVPVLGIVRCTRGHRIIRKYRNACFYMDQRVRFYTRTMGSKNEVTYRRRKSVHF